ncbi:hypothetical protein FB45DRAFT_940924 [Roridomyces roridus]|uniref:Uncharacterized protein n=1 Tax=Roridomyces roridus TaxID=1738132 RepID=A0AAD7FCA4_9AGAR|nr:hypothetical protein FB45DRAFT_940924 [Roridomyces roridus]
MLLRKHPKPDLPESWQDLFALVCSTIHPAASSQIDPDSETSARVECLKLEAITVKTTEQMSRLTELKEQLAQFGAWNSERIQKIEQGIWNLFELIDELLCSQSSFTFTDPVIDLVVQVLASLLLATGSDEHRHIPEYTVPFPLASDPLISLTREEFVQQLNKFVAIYFHAEGAMKQHAILTENFQKSILRCQKAEMASFNAQAEVGRLHESLEKLEQTETAVREMLTRVEKELEDEKSHSRQLTGLYESAEADADKLEYELTQMARSAVETETMCKKFAVRLLVAWARVRERENATAELAKSLVQEKQARERLAAQYGGISKALAVSSTSVNVLNERNTTLERDLAEARKQGEEQKKAAEARQASLQGNIADKSTQITGLWEDIVHANKLTAERDEDLEAARQEVKLLQTLLNEAVKARDAATEERHAAVRDYRDAGLERDQAIQERDEASRQRNQASEGWKESNKVLKKNNEMLKKSYDELREALEGQEACKASMNVLSERNTTLERDLAEARKQGEDQKKAAEATQVLLRGNITEKSAQITALREDIVYANNLTAATSESNIQLSKDLEDARQVLKTLETLRDEAFRGRDEKKRLNTV